jgi:hypothetical protein
MAPDFLQQRPIIINQLADALRRAEPEFWFPKPGSHSLRNGNRTRLEGNYRSNSEPQDLHRLIPRSHGVKPHACFFHARELACDGVIPIYAEPHRYDFANLGQSHENIPAPAAKAEYEYVPSHPSSSGVRANGSMCRVRG